MVGAPGGSRSASESSQACTAHSDRVTCGERRRDKRCGNAHLVVGFDPRLWGTHYMAEHEIDYIRGIPEAFRYDAARLYDAAFGDKFAVTVPRRSARIELIAQSLRQHYAVAAVDNGRLVGLVGFHTAEGSLTGGMSYSRCVSTLGPIRGTWAALVLSLYRRTPGVGQLLLDGIAVLPSSRGRGVGTRLLTILDDIAYSEGYEQLRLDVVDTNPGARRLYERNGFSATQTVRFGYLRPILGFGASTTMVRRVSRTAP